MDHAVNIWMRLEDFLQISFLSDVHLMKFWPFAAYKLDAVERDLEGVVQIVNNHDFVAVFEEGQRGERSNITRPTKKKKPIVSLVWMTILVHRARPYLQSQIEKRYCATYPVIRTVPTVMLFVSRLQF